MTDKEILAELGSNWVLWTELVSASNWSNKTFRMKKLTEFLIQGYGLTAYEKQASGKIKLWFALEQ